MDLDDLSKCLYCGELCDGDVCDDRCARALDARKEAQGAAAMDAEGVLVCHYCGNPYFDTPRKKPICNLCLDEEGY